MNSLKVCFIGIGSIAKRHITNLRHICKEKHIELLLDAVRSNRRSLLDNINDMIDATYYSFDSMPSDYDVVFITNPTEFHIETLKKVHDKARCFFIEKPIVSFSKIHEAIEFETTNEKLYYVACPLRYTNVIQYLKENINVEEVISVRCISSSYLPDWRPGIDYRKTYSAQKELGGGVSIDLVHEWDYLTFLFGKPNRVKCMIGKKSKLEIDSDDYAVYIAEYKDKILELHLDYFGRKPIRNITLFTDKDTIECDLIASRIEYKKSGKVIEFGEVRNDFQIKEMQYFLSLVEKNVQSHKEFEHAISVLRLTQGDL